MGEAEGNGARVGEAVLVGRGVEVGRRLAVADGTGEGVAESVGVDDGV